MLEISNQEINYKLLVIGSCQIEMIFTVLLLIS